jgi:porin
MPSRTLRHFAPLVCLVAGLGSETVPAESAAPGITFDAAYIGDAARNVDGGLRTGSAYLDNLDLQLNAERGSLFGIPGLSGLLYVLHNNSSEFSAEYVGDSHIVSSIDAPGAWRVFEAWLDWAPGSGAVSTRLGLYDLNSEFDSIETAGLFVNGAQGMGTDLGQSGLNGPSVFPVSSLALRLHADFDSGAYGQVAVLDGVPGDPDDPESNRIDLSSDDGALLVAEFGWGDDDWRKLALGTWMYTADFAPLASPDGPEDDGNWGWYAIADRTLWRGESATLAGYVRIGQAEDRFNPMDNYLGLGASVAGFLASRPDDELGLAVASGTSGDGLKAARQLDDLGTDSRETTIELTYRAPLTDWLTIQPDVQYIINPGFEPAFDNSLVILLRFELSYSKRLTGS